MAEESDEPVAQRIYNALQAIEQLETPEAEEKDSLEHAQVYGATGSATTESSATN
ncbi:hypothetical protein [Glutamicibacter sp. NPDC087344]|uniref:hypothetical protein n=1 Tax=Glutamicibacter sp. NPDC087344 TaxID=3363994 RepID=UPI00381CF153